MKQIWKYNFALHDAVSIPMPKGARVLCTQLQRGVPTLWALVDPTAKREPRRFCIVGTGDNIADRLANWQYVGTWQDGEFVWHLFEEK